MLGVSHRDTIVVWFSYQGTCTALIWSQRYVYCLNFLTKVRTIQSYHTYQDTRAYKREIQDIRRARTRSNTHTRTQVNGDWSARRLAVIPDLLSVNTIWLSWCETGTIKLKFTLIFRYSGHRLREGSACESWETITVILFLKKRALLKKSTSLFCQCYLKTRHHLEMQVSGKRHASKPMTVVWSLTSDLSSIFWKETFVSCPLSSCFRQRPDLIVDWCSHILL